MEHWLPLFHTQLDTLFDYVPGTPVVLEPLAEDAAHERLAQIADYYEARAQALKERRDAAYQPLPPDRLYLGETNGGRGSRLPARARLTPFAMPEARDVIDIGAQPATISRPSAPSRTPMCSRRSPSMCRRCRRPASAS